MDEYANGTATQTRRSFLKGAAEAPPNIRRELWSEANNLWTESEMDLGVEGRLRDCGDLRFDGGNQDVKARANVRIIRRP